jgi:drug/metabolite transporter (DMT)-like permease
VNRGSLYVAAAATLWGTWPLWMRAARLPPLVHTLTVLLALAVSGLPLALVASRRRGRRSGRAWAGVALLGLFDAGNNALFFAALATGAIAPAVLSHYMAPVVVAASAPRLLGEPLRRRTPGAVALALGGMLALLQPWRMPLRAPVAAGAALGAASALFYAGNVLVSKRLVVQFAPIELTSA